MSSTDTAAQAAIAPERAHRTDAVDTRAVIPTARTAWLRYMGGMGLALLPFLLLYDDPHWLNIIAFTYLMGGWRPRGISSAASAASFRWAMACSSRSVPTSPRRW